MRSPPTYRPARNPARLAGPPASPVTSPRLAGPPASPVTSPRLAGPPASPVIPARAGVTAPPALARRWPLAAAAVKSGALLVIAAALVHSGNIIDNSDPNGLGPGPDHGWTRVLLLRPLSLVVTALIILIRGVAASVEQRRSCT